MSKQWTASGELRGEALIVQDGYPIEYTLKDRDSGERVVIQYQQPKTEPRPGPTDFPVGVQEFELVVTAEKSRVEALVEGLLETVTACLSFGTRRPVEWAVGRLTECDPPEGQPPESLFLVSPAGTYKRVLGFQTAAFNRLLDGIGEWDSPRGRKLVRSLRWLSRSRRTTDFVEQFSFLAMSLASLTGLLPEPPVRRDEESHEAAALRHFALDKVGVEEEEWKLVGRLRNELFHGGLLESPESRKRLSAGVPPLRRVVVEALQYLLELPDGIPADDPMDELGFVTEPVTFRPHEEDDDNS